MDFLESDRRHVWHPYTQMLTAPDPLPVTRASGAYLYLADGTRLIDAISSWWVTVHGHAEPSLAAAISAQAFVLEQVIFAGFTHPQAARLAERLAKAAGFGLNRCFFSDDGSTAVEVALKMAWQYWQNHHENRHRIIAFEHAYHGDTFGAMSVSGRSVFTKAFDPLLFEVLHLPSPCETSLEQLSLQLRQALDGGDIAALILEPLVQGAGGMKMCSPAVLEQILLLCRNAGVPVIFDEVMTGFWRTGKMFAAHHLSIGPDIICLSKGLTGGFLPLSVTLCTDTIYEAFLSSDKSKMLFHGHSFTANPLGCAAANASLDLFEQQATLDKISVLCELQATFAKTLMANTAVHNVRHQGTILAFDLIPEKEGGYLDPAALRLRDAMMEKGILLRPLGETVYLLPPYSITTEDLQYVHRCLITHLEEKSVGK